MRRALLAVTVFFSTLVFGTLAILFCLLVPTGNPLLWFARPWARSILAVAGVSVRARGGERLATLGPVLLLTNHQSLFDVLALIVALPGQYRMIAKRELFAIPVFGWAISAAGFIAINRSDREQAFKGLDRAAEAMRRGRSIVIFVEGTRSRDGSLLPFKKGAFILALRSGRPIVPVTISGSRAVLARESLAVRPGPVDVVVGEPITTAGLEIPDRDVLMAVTRRAVEAEQELARGNAAGAAIRSIGASGTAELVRRLAELAEDPGWEAALRPIVAASGGDTSSSEARLLYDLQAALSSRQAPSGGRP